MTDTNDTAEWARSRDTVTGKVKGDLPFEATAPTGNELKKAFEQAENLSEEEELNLIVELVDRYVVEPDVDWSDVDITKVMAMWGALQKAWQESDDIAEAMEQVDVPGNRQTSPS